MEKLIDALRKFIKKIFLETFYKKRKKVTYFLTTFNIFHKNYIKTFIK